MGARPSAAQEAAEKEFKAARKKPSARELAARHGLSESTIHRAKWYVEYKKTKEGGSGADRK